MHNPVDEAACLATAVALAKAAGAQIMTAFSARKTDYDRKTLTDPVTETDHAVEAFLFRELRAAYPNHAFIGEESAASAALTDTPTWIVDPIDGTANFVHRLHSVCVSIGLVVNRKTVVGVVYNPVLDELFTATTSAPATLNGTPISVSSTTALPSACVMTELGSDRDPAKVDLMLTNLRSLLKANVQCVRASGSCALGMCYVACGRVDSYSEYGPWAWDMAGGALIVEKAGGVVVGASGEKFDLEGRSLLVCTPGIMDEILSIHTPLIKKAAS